MPTLNIEGNLLSDTEANWAADAVVYTDKQMLISTDAQFGSTDQNKFKLANGADTWANLDYMPIGIGGTNAYSLTWDGFVFNPADLTEYFIAAGIQMKAPATITTFRQWHQIPVTASNFTLNISLQVGNVPTAELATWTMYNRTQVTSQVISAVYDVNARVPIFYDFTLAFVQGDIMEISFTTPAYATNPTSLQLHLILNFQAD